MTALALRTVTAHHTAGMKTRNGNSKKLAPLMNNRKRKQAKVSEQDNLEAHSMKRHRGHNLEGSKAHSNEGGKSNYSKDHKPQQRTRNAKVLSPVVPANTTVNYDELPDFEYPIKPYTAAVSTMPRTISVKTTEKEDIGPSSLTRHARAFERKKDSEENIPQAPEVKVQKAPKRLHMAKDNKNPKYEAINLDEEFEANEATRTRLDEHELKVDSNSHISSLKAQQRLTLTVWLQSRKPLPALRGSTLRQTQVVPNAPHEARSIPSIKVRCSQKLVVTCN